MKLSILRGNAVKFVFTSLVVMQARGLVHGEGIVDIIESCADSGHNAPYGVTTFEADKAFKPNGTGYFLASANFSQGNVLYIQANLTKPYTPTSYKLDLTVTNARNRNPSGFRLLGCTSVDEDGNDIWTILDERPHVYWSETKSEWVKSFAIAFPQACTKLKFEVFDVCGADKLCIHQLTFDDEPQTGLCDLVSMVRARGGASAAVGTSGAVLGGAAANVFDGSLTFNNSTYAGLWCAANNADTRFVILTLDTEALGGVLPILTGYQLYNATDHASNLPERWAVYASEKENPTEDDWQLVDERVDGVAGPRESIAGKEFVVIEAKTQKAMRARKIKFEVKKTRGANKIILSEVRFLGVIPSDSGDSTCRIYDAEVTEPQPQKIVVRTTVVPKSGAVEPYDLSVECVHENRTNVIELATASTEIGTRVFELDGLKLGADYKFHLRLVNGGGLVSQSPEMVLHTAPELMGDLPGGFKALEYVESTENGKQLVDLRFKPSGFFGLEADCLVYSPLTKSNVPSDATLNTYGGIYGTEEFALTTSTGSKGSYKTGFRIDNKQTYYDAYLTIRERMLIASRGATYSVTCGATTRNGTRSDVVKSENNLYVFGCASSAKPNGGEWGIVRFYSIKTYNEQMTPAILTHQFVPAEAEDGTRGFYDVLDDNPETAWCPSKSENDVELAAGPLVSSKMIEANVAVFTGSRLQVVLTRTDTSADDPIYAAWGPVYAASEPTNWSHRKKMTQSFVAGGTSASVSFNDLTADDVYVRFYTESGLWSQTVYLPDLKKTPRGLVIFFN